MMQSMSITVMQDDGPIGDGFVGHQQKGRGNVDGAEHAAACASLVSSLVQVSKGEESTPTVCVSLHSIHGAPMQGRHPV